MKLKYVLGILIIMSIIFISGCIQKSVESSVKQKYEENLSWQCQRCPDVCRDKNGEKINDLNESGSCICVEENGKCVRKIKQFVYYAPEIKPENFLGPYIFEEAYSNWMDYKPLKQKVEELTAGLDNNMDKAIAIATWVKYSRNYSRNYKYEPNGSVINVFPMEKSSIANQGGTIIDIFEEKEGVCLDAAILTTAMMRLAGIPAIVVEQMKEGMLPHAHTYFYANGRWWAVDATFAGNNTTVYNIAVYNTTNYDVGLTLFYLCRNPYREESAYKEYTYYLVFPVKLNGKYGKICLPFISNYGQELKYTSPDPKYGQYKWLFILGWKPGENLYNLKHRWQYYVMENEKICNIRNYFSDYLYCLQLPTGKYEITYSAFVEEDEHGGRKEIPVAVLKFEMKENETKILTEDDFIKYENATEEQFNLFIKYVKKILSYQHT